MEQQRPRMIFLMLPVVTLITIAFYYYVPERDTPSWAIQRTSLRQVPRSPEWLKPYRAPVPTLNSTYVCHNSSVQPSHYVCVHPIKDDNYISEIVRTGSGRWETQMRELIQKYLSEYPTAVFVDLGANIGVHALFAAALGHLVVAVEAFHGHWPVLDASVQRNHFQARFTILPFGISDKHGQVNLSMSQANLAMTSIHAANTKGVRPIGVQASVRLITLEDLVPFIPPKVAVLKVDVEMHECFVMRAGRSFFKSVFVPYLLMEWQHIYKVDAECRSQMVSTLQESGFQPFQFNGQPVDLSKREKHIDIVWVNNG